MIEINNLTTISIDEGFLRKVIKKILEGEKIKKEIELSLALIGPGRMRKINKRYRGKNRITDVLAFPELKILLEKFRVGPAKKTQGLGEIVICLREVKKNAKRFARPNFVKQNLDGFASAFEKELAKVLIHGILHLLGYDHEISPEKAEEMKKKENKYLESIF